ncbi:hypothetical protein AKJ09_07122 [Labilithrix luteola]|uniref:Type IV fimbrial biogenesis protein PilY1 n=1 Tax=Labilithrix luteola TaxID=1391654 RepID=A0A0K1Q402_9BACT|nr:hypothetical protein [Labilithrix luteola]AKV00459.1 hypothetical protein AKJ09_07122 [Labilithrix luteola]
MKKSHRTALPLMALSSLLGIWACASTGDDSPSPKDPESIVPMPDAASEAAVEDAATDQDASPKPCKGGSDCTAYPNDCSNTTLCAANVSFDSSARLTSMWASSDSDIWGAGTMGVVLHYDGSAWKALPTGSLVTVHAISGTAANDVWFASTDRTMLHTRGVDASGKATFEIYDASSSGDNHIMQSMWGSPQQGIYALIDNHYGANGLILHSTGWQTGVGPSWTFDLAPTWMDPPGPYGGRSLVGFGTDDVWSGWLGGRLYRRVAGKWRELNSTTTESLNGMWGTSGDDLWLAGTNGAIRHWDGKVMSTVEVEPVLRDRALYAVAGTTGTDVWFVGDEALVLHWDGQKLSRIPVGGLKGRRPALRGVWVSPTSDHVWIVGDGIVLEGKKGALQ